MSRLIGFDATFTLFRNLQEKAPVAAHNVVRDMTEKIYNKSQELVPVSNPQHEGWRPSVERNPSPREVDPGYLKEGGNFTVTVENGVATGRVFYSASYAVWVHERFANHDAPTQWKYLETAVVQLAPDLPDIAARAWRAEYGAFTFGNRYVPPGEEA